MKGSGKRKGEREIGSEVLAEALEALPHQLLGRASREPHSYVLTRLSVTIYRYRPADRCL